MKPSRAVKLFGTEEPVAEMLTLSAGPLEACLDAGNLRYIKVAGKEAIRGIAFLSRDSSWGTRTSRISNLKVEQRPDRFTVTYDADYEDRNQTFRYAARIEGRADGALSFAADGEAISDFVTNRTGFVVLHPLEGVAGAPLVVEHVDGRVVEGRFPDLVDPDCPYKNIRALTHAILPGLKVECRMEGDTFEMEDQRNWMDASYKTYVRPGALPWPYTIKSGEMVSQRVALRLEGAVQTAPRAAAGNAVVVRIGGTVRAALPRLGLAAPAGSAGAAIDYAALIKNARPSFLVCHFDARDGDDVQTMRNFAELGAATGARLVLEAVLPSTDADGIPTDDGNVLRRDMAAIRSTASAAGATFSAVAVSPASDLKRTIVGSGRPKTPTWEQLFAAARSEFPGALIGGGMFSYFTELNRKRPPAALLDFICHTGLPLVHAGDDASMTETLEALPSIFRSVAAFAGGKPYWIFPTAISMRANPYAAGPAENPHNIRQPISAVDPRERGLIGAAWYAGYLARAALGGVDALTLAAVGGPSGIVYAKQPHAQPWFDEAEPAVYPHYQVIAGYNALAGSVLATESSEPRRVQALAVASDGRLALRLCNLTGVAQTAKLSGTPGNGEALFLDEESFEAACRDPDWRKSAERMAVNAGALTLRPYAVAELSFGSSD